MIFIYSEHLTEKIIHSEKILFMKNQSLEKIFAFRKTL